MSTKKSKRYQFWKAPLRILVKIKNFYMKSMIFCDGRVGYGNYMGGPMSQATTIPKSFSVRSSRSNNNDDDEDFRELMKAASTRRLGLDVVQRRQQRATGSNDVQRSRSVGSRSVGIGTIDEDKPCDFGDAVEVKADLYPRSKSHAVSSSRTKSTSLL